MIERRSSIVVTLMLIAIGIIGSTGCERSQPVEQPVDSATVESETTVQHAEPPGSDPGEGAVSCDPNYRPPETSGGTCAPPGEGNVPGECDPVAQTGCGEGEHCRFSVLLDEGQKPTGFVRICQPFDCRVRRLPPGASCMAGQCLPGSVCVSGSCRRICERATGDGCAADEFCVETSLNPTYGYCYASCG